MRLDINFASREYVFVRKVYSVMIAGILICLALLAYGLAAYQADVGQAETLTAELEGTRARISLAESKLSGLSALVDKTAVEQAYEDAQFANNAIRRRVFSWTLFLNRLEELVPDGVSISGIRPNFSSLDVDLSGTARDVSKVTEFMGRLAESEYFGDIPPTFSATEGMPDINTGKSVWAFNLKTTYYPDGHGPSSGVAGDGE